MDRRPVIAITVGDPAGIGPEILVKALSLREIYSNSIPVVIGDYGTVRDALAIAGSVQRIYRLPQGAQPIGEHGVIDLVDLANVEPGPVSQARGTAQSARAAGEYFEKAREMARRGLVHAVVGGPTAGGTLPESVTSAGLLTVELLGKLRVAYPAVEVPLKDVPEQVTSESVYSSITLAHQACTQLGVANPRLAVVGLNARPVTHPGPEEQSAIRPAVLKAGESGISVIGPVPIARAILGVLSGEQDMAVSMYHEQGAVPMALLRMLKADRTGRWSSAAGVRAVWGMPFSFITVDHDPMFEVAGRNRADAASLVEAIRVAATVAASGSSELDPWPDVVRKRASV